MAIEPATQAMSSVAACRRAIDDVDDALLRLVIRRAALVEALQQIKRAAGLPRRDPSREREIAQRLAALEPGLSREHVQRLVRAVIDVCVDIAVSRDAEVDPASELGWRAGDKAAG